MNNPHSVGETTLKDTFLLIQPPNIFLENMEVRFLYFKIKFYKSADHHKNLINFLVFTTKYNTIY